MKIHIREKMTRRTYLAFISKDSSVVCAVTGNKVLIRPGESGYSEYNDRGEPVLESWIDQPVYVRLVA